MSVSVHDVLNDPSSTALDEQDGTYIAPQAIEVKFRVVCPIASAMLVHADGRNYATALVTLDPETLDQWGRAQSLPGAACAALAADTTVRSCVDVLNGRLNPWETIKEFRILDHDHDLTVDDGELTPSLKVRRQVIESRHRAQLDFMYAGQRRG